MLKCHHYGNSYHIIIYECVADTKNIFLKFIWTLWSQIYSIFSIKQDKIDWKLLNWKWNERLQKERDNLSVWLEIFLRRYWLTVTSILYSFLSQYWWPFSIFSFCHFPSRFHPRSFPTHLHLHRHKHFQGSNVHWRYIVCHSKSPLQLLPVPRQ